MTRKLIGMLLIGFGLSAILLPVLQALLFFGVGLFVLRDQFDWARAAVERVRRLAPAAVGGAEAAEARLVGWCKQAAETLRHRIQG